MRTIEAWCNGRVKPIALQVATVVLARNQPSFVISQLTIIISKKYLGPTIARDVRFSEKDVSLARETVIRISLDPKEPYSSTAIGIHVIAL